MRWWLGRKSAPVDSRPLVPAWLSTRSTEDFARSYDSQFDEVYRRNPVGQRSVRLIAGMLGALPVYAVEGDERAAAIASADGLLGYGWSRRRTCRTLRRTACPLRSATSRPAM